MGPLFSILFAAFFGAVWIALLLLFLLSERRVLRWLFGGILTLLSLLAVAAVLAFGYGLIQSFRPSAVFKISFNQAPPAGVSAIQSKHWAFGDSGDTYLRFQATPEAFKKILPSRMENVDAENFKDRLGDVIASSKPPNWWSPTIPKPGNQYYHFSSGFGNGRRFGSENEFLVYDSETQIAHYFYSGVD